MVVDLGKLSSVTIDLEYDGINELWCETSMREEEVCLADIVDLKTCLFLCCLRPQPEGCAVIRKWL